MSWINDVMNKRFEYYDGTGRSKVGNVVDYQNNSLVMEDGTFIPEDVFRDVAFEVENQGNANNSANHDKQDILRGEKPIMPPARDEFFQYKLDSSGIPILPTGDGENFEEESHHGNVEKSEPREIRKKGDPNINALIDSANKKSKKISISIEVDVIDTKLYKLLIENFGEKAEDQIIDNISSSIQNRIIRDLIKERLYKLYNPKNKKSDGRNEQT